MRRRGTNQTFLNFCYVHQRRSVYLYRSAYSCAPEGSATRNTVTMTIEFSRDVERSTAACNLEFDVRTGIVREQFTNEKYRQDPSLHSDELTFMGVDLPTTATSSSSSASSITTSSSESASTSASQLESPTRNAAAGSTVRAHCDRHVEPHCAQADRRFSIQKAREAEFYFAFHHANLANVDSFIRILAFISKC